jgi:hypothetical protein
MSTKRTFYKFISAAAMLAALVETDGWLSVLSGQPGFIVAQAQARVGRPVTPGSVAGVARRTTRRTIRRTSMYVTALPAGCAKTSVGGAVVWRCGGAYYQSAGGRYVVVNVD